MVKLILSGVVAYLLGSVTLGMIVPRLMGSTQDVRKEGSGSVGATNVLRTRGKLPGALVLLGDLLKGSLAAVIGIELAGPSGGAVAGVCALLGHCFPLYYGFKGGRGVATAAGVVFVMFPESMLILLPVFIIAVAVTKIVSVGSLLAAVALAICVWLFQPLIPVGWVSIFAALLVIWKHEGNIRRLIAGTENKLGAVFGASSPEKSVESDGGGDGVEDGGGDAED
jgi:glycerol-3-phosphate acyltransferase PlsY